MLTDTPSDGWARDLLHHAARTIEVSPAGPLRTDHRRRWPALVAAAAVAALVLGVALLGRGGDKAPAPVVVTPVAPAASVVPSVFGLNRTEAHARLEQAGLSVTDRVRSGCETAQQAIGTVPVTGEPVPPDHTVTLLVAELTALGSCTQDLARRTQAWDFLGFLDGRRPAPAFADTVTLLDGGKSTTLTAAQAADPSNWLPTDFRDAMGASDATMATATERDRTCRTSVSDSIRDGQSFLGIEIGHYLSPPQGCLPRVDLHYTGGLIDTIGFGSPPSPLIPVAQVAQRYVGLSEGEARSAVAAAGADVTTYVVYREAGCDTTGRVTEQSPAPGTILKGSVVLTIDVDRADCGRPTAVTQAQQTVAQQLIAWAAGDGPAPPLADPVELYVGHAAAGSVAADAAPTAWRGCPADTATYDGAFECPVALLGGVGSDAETGAGSDVLARADPLPCGGGLAAPRLPGRVTALASFVLVPGSGLSCLGGYRLQVFLDGQGRIAAVDTLLSSP